MAYSRDLPAERQRLAKGLAIVIRTADLTDLELHLIRKAKPDADQR